MSAVASCSIISMVVWLYIDASYWETFPLVSEGFCWVSVKFPLQAWCETSTGFVEGEWRSIRV